MTTRLLNWLRRTRPTTSRRPARRAPTLGLERLDERLVPVVGAFSVPNTVAMTGVVQITENGHPHCTGTLLADGRHVLSAAHCFDDNHDGVVDANDFAVTINSRTFSPTSIVLHPNWDPGSESTLAANDIAVLTLPALAPSAATRYDLFRGTNEVGQLFQMAGWGLTGVGATGANPNVPQGLRSGYNRFDATAAPLNDEVQVVQVTGAGIGGTFQLSLDGQSTSPIPFNATATAVRTALEAVAGVGNVAVQTAPGDQGFWFVRFQGTKAGTNVDPLVIDAAGLTGPAATNVFERSQGGTFAPTVQDTRLVADFDDGTAEHDAFGLWSGLPDLGHGVKEAFGASGDSGGPALIGGQIAGVLSSVLTVGRAPDVDLNLNSSFGEFEVLTRVSKFASWIDGIVTHPHELVVDLANESASSVTARRAGTNLEVLLDGVVIDSEPLSQITGLRILGTASAHTYTIGSGLTIPVEVVGQGADNDTLVGPDDANTWQISAIPQSETEVFGAQGTIDGSITFQDMRYLRGGSGADVFKFADTTQVHDGAPFLFGINGGNGSDTLDYSNATFGVSVNLGAGTATGWWIRRPSSHPWG
jgi:hypothetical protein